jgi:6-pyruvoyltetrahydropterin/6-carboxytetrahydropterin synthase
MSGITAVRRLQFCAGHRVLNHESKCRNIHGHNYVVFLHAEGVDRPLDKLGRVVDFSALKERFGAWIDYYWDHGFIVHQEDLEVRKILEQVEGQKVFVCDTNPTAENLARHLLAKGPLLLSGTGTRLIKVQIWETENCFAEAVL